MQPFGNPPGHGSGGDDVSSGILPIGTRIGAHYRIQRVLGRGSMGVVYLARDQALERDVAIKFLGERYAADEKVARRFQREGVAMASVRNPHVVQIFSFGEHRGQPYFVMEYVPGYTVGSLVESANIRREYLYLDVVIGILAQVCRGLQAVHEAGIVHRDVKPANMLVGPSFRVALADFGLVETLEQASALRDLAGTPLYLAPELIRRQHLPDNQRHLSDIYGLGISTYEMLTGDVPFNGKTIKEILRRHIEDAARPVSELRADLPAALDDVLARAMSKDPLQRFASCGAFHDALSSARASASGRSIFATGRRILIVDDDQVSLQVHSTALKIGFPDAVITTANDGVAALSRIRDVRPDLVLVDMSLPTMNGLELCAALSGDEVTSEIPLLVTAERFDGDCRTVLRSLGIRDALLKPVDVTHLVNLARRHLEPDD